jgi:4-hydroxy-tetrahydrodipicolinate synthase
MATKGIFAAVVTPVDNTGAISVERYCRHARWLLRQGCAGLGVFGTTSEANSFSVAERQATLEAFLAAGLPADKIILGVGTCARNDTVALARHALEHGITELLMLPPFFYKNNADEGLFRAFAEVIDSLADDRLQLYLYHFPQVSGVPVTKGVIERLVAGYPDTVKGVKDSSGDWEHTKGLIEGFPGLAIYSGNDGHLLDNLETGGAGTISAAANLAVEESAAVFAAFSKGDRAAAEAGMTVVTNVRRTLADYPLIPAIKHVIADGQHDPVWRTVRPPLLELDAASGAKLIAALDAAGYAYDPDLYSVAGA